MAIFFDPDWQGEGLATNEITLSVPFGTIGDSIVVFVGHWSYETPTVNGRTRLYSQASNVGFHAVSAFSWPRDGSETSIHVECTGEIAASAGNFPGLLTFDPEYITENSLSFDTSPYSYEYPAAHQDHAIAGVALSVGGNGAIIDEPVTGDIVSFNLNRELNSDITYFAGDDAGTWVLADGVDSKVHGFLTLVFAPPVAPATGGALWSAGWS